MNCIQCLDRFVVLCIDIPESEFTAIWTLSISWSGQYSCSLNTSIQTFCEIAHQKDHRIKTFCVIEHWTDHRIQISVC